MLTPFSKMQLVKKIQRLALLFAGGLITVPVLSQKDKYPRQFTPSAVVVNYTIPKTAMPPGEIMQAVFSDVPTDEEIYRVHFFEEPLVPGKGDATDEESRALIGALAGYSQRKGPDDFKAIHTFLDKYPQSRWRGTLLANLGILYRRNGYFNEAMAAWEESWSLLKNQKEHQVKVMADRVVSELLMINSWVGRTERIEELLEEIKNRVIEGPAVERVSMMRTALWTMKNRPGVSYKCGPYALNRLFALQDSIHPYSDTLMAVQSTARGFSLLELKNLAEAVHLKYQMAFRKPGSAIIPNAVVHWKLDHYSALLTAGNEQYRCADATMGTFYGQEFWLTRTALDSSASGYFLVPDGPLPQGWRTVSESEGSTVYGKGNEIPDPGKHVSPDDPQEPKQCTPQPMAHANVHLLAVSLHVYDQPVYYTPPVGPPMLWNMDYHQRDSYQPANFSYSNLGPKWTFNWLSYVIDNPNNTSASADVYVMGGGARSFVNFNTTTHSYAPEMQTSDVLVRVCPTCYELRHPDGSKEVYARPDGNTSAGRKIFLTQKVDAAGNAMTILYDANLRVVGLKDAINQVTTLSYELSASTYKITKVTDPFGRYASFEYDASGRLNKITDMIGIVSTFTYDASDFITKMTTPYGTTGFTKQEGNGTGSSPARVLETNYPLGEKERVEYLEFAPGINMSEPLTPTNMLLLNTYMVYRNTFYWDKKAMKSAPGDYTAAKIYHWMHGSATINENGTAAQMLESVKNPLENRIWYSYQGQSSVATANQGMSSKPAEIGRVLDDSTTQLSRHFYNAIGKDTAIIDPIGRKTSYKYDTTNINLLEVRQTKNGANELLAAFTYNSQHLPLTAKDASGLITSFTYNSAGQLLTVTNPKSETTTLSYNANGYLQNITGPVAGAAVSFTYDGYGRVRTVTDPEGYTIRTDYDALDRPTVITYPDSTYEQIVYDRMDAVHRRDRINRWSHSLYDSLDRPSATIDALSRVTQFIWCSCGSLSEIIDPLKQVTSFVRDLQGRVVSKQYADGKRMVYTYENTTSRLKEVRDAKGQKTTFNYYADDNLKQKTYTNATIATPSVSFTYDSSYNRIKTMTDGTGTTTYTYKNMQSGAGSGQLATVDGPLGNDVIAYSYDALGRVENRSINGVAASVMYDALGRVTTVTNVLGSFVYNYINQTQRLSSVNLPNGQTTVYDYFNNSGDQRLKGIWNKAPDGTTLSKFGYEYDREGQITKWTQQAGTTTPNYWELGYDLSNQLTSATEKNESTAAIVKRYAYQYDKTGNRTSEQLDNSVTAAAYNNVNQLMQQAPGGPMRFAGTLNEFAAVKLQNTTTADTVTAQVDTANAFEAFVKVQPGTNSIAVVATDYSNNTTTSNYSIAVSSGSSNYLAYDSNGNTLTATNSGITYDWDAEDRLVKITQGTAVTEFVYDGYSRRVAEKLNGTIIKRWLWEGIQMVEERNAAGGTVIKRFFNQGEQIDGTSYFFAFDHLGSVREVTDGSAAAQARYNYDPYGRRTRTFGSIDADFGYTGHYYHTATGLYLTLHRAYNVNAGRWLSRDPIGETDGSNLYAYVKNNLINSIDPSGLNSVVDGIVGNNGGQAWKDAFNNPWKSGPTGGYLPQDLSDGLNNVRRNLEAPCPQENGMHAWHAASNAYLVEELGIVGVPLILAGGIIHESPLDWNSFVSEQNYQGTINHILDSGTDIIANVLGTTMGILLPEDLSIPLADRLGDHIPGPGDPDPMVQNKCRCKH